MKKKHYYIALFLFVFICGLVIKFKDIENKKAESLGRLKQLGYILNDYARKHNGFYPDDLSILNIQIRESYIISCVFNDSTKPKLVAKQNDSLTPYQTVLVYCNCFRNQGAILFVAGNVEWSTNIAVTLTTK